MLASFSSISMYGYVSVRDVSLMSSASHSTFERAWCAPSWTLHRPRYVERPVPFEIDLETIDDVV